MPASDLFPSGGVPADVLVLHPDGGEPTILCCPLTGVPLTVRMAAAAGLDAAALTAMLERRAPLGTTPETWDAIRREVEAALESPGPGGAALADAPAQVAVGGSAVGCFSSARTTLGKKHFPADETELEEMVRSAPGNQGLDASRLEAIVGDALTRYRALGLNGRTPRAVWFNILHVLGGIEDPADLDLQVHSELIDRVLGERASADPGILERRDHDRLGRWHPEDVYRAFPALVDLLRRLHDLGNCALEFLGPGGEHTIAERTDWWPVAERRGR